MKVIKNNYKPDNDIEHTCPYCNSQFTYNKDDIRTTALDTYIWCPCCDSRIYIGEEKSDNNYICSDCSNEFCAEPYIGANGILWAKCPYCGAEEYIDDGIALTVDNIEYPTHFYKYDSKYTKEVSDERITEQIKRLINKINKDNDFYYWASGDTVIVVYKSDEDFNEVQVIVCRKYSESNVQIPKEKF